MRNIPNTKSIWYFVIKLYIIIHNKFQFVTWHTSFFIDNWIGSLFRLWMYGCIFYAGDMLLLSASVNGSHDLMNVCVELLSNLDLKFNCSKSFCIAFGFKHGQPISNMCHCVLAILLFISLDRLKLISWSGAEIWQLHISWWIRDQKKVLFEL